MSETASDFAGEVEMTGATLDWLDMVRMPDAVEACCTPLAWGGADFISGCVCCIFTVAFGSAGAELFGASVGRLMRAVSFFGEAGFATTPDAPGAGGGMTPEGAGFRGMVGLLTMPGGFGGGVRPLMGLESGGGAGGAEGRLIGGGVITPDAGRETFDVSFFGALLPASGMLIRTVSRLATGLSVFDGRVMRIVSFLSASSLVSAEEMGFSSAMECGGSFFSYLSGAPECQQVCRDYPRFVPLKTRPQRHAAGPSSECVSGCESSVSIHILVFLYFEKMEIHPVMFPVSVCEMGAMKQWNGSRAISLLSVGVAAACTEKTTNLSTYLMKKILSILTIAALSLAITAPAQAGKGGKKGGKKAAAALLSTYDKDGNGKIDGDEVTALKADFTAGKPEVKALDTNADGTLSDEEIAAVGGKHKKKKNK